MRPSNHRHAIRALTQLSATLLVLSALPGCGVEEPATGSEPVAARTSALTGSLTISGVVTDTSGLPVDGVRVTLSGSAQASAVTDLSGHYSFSVNPGSYSLTPSGFCGAFQPNVVNLNNVTANTAANFVGSGGFCSALTFSGGTSGSLTISGVVTSAGHAVPGAKVTLAGSTTGFRISDQAGAYTFSVNPGSYSLKVTGGCPTNAPSVVNLNNITTSRTQNFTGTGSTCPIAPLAMCPQLDVDFIGMSLPPACNIVSPPDCGFERAETWDDVITLDFAIPLTSDCHFGQWASLLTSTDVVNYLNDLLSFGLAFYGCPATGTQTGPLSYQLIPSALLGRPFTTADLQLISAYYSAAIAQALSDNGSPPLTTAQVNAINAQLAFLAGLVPNVTTSSSFTYSTCP